ADAVRSAPLQRQLALLRAHPELGARQRLTAASAAEQRGAGLDRLDDARQAAFEEGNRAYRARFGFPFIIAVKGRQPAEVLQALRARLGRSAAEERAAAIEEVLTIAGLRLDERLGEGDRA
ncbi:2-oxo-4-hydroxy-4-carboxy-5-ureidoimidazoline decarboxylase, partial [Paenibacillus sp. IB182496]